MTATCWIELQETILIIIYEKFLFSYMIYMQHSRKLCIAIVHSRVSRAVYISCILLTYVVVFILYLLHIETFMYTAIAQQKIK